MQAVVGRQKEGHGPRRFMRREWKLRTRVRQHSLFANNIIYRMLFFVKKFLVQLTYKDVDRFPSTIYIAHSHEITNEPCTSSNYDNTGQD